MTPKLVIHMELGGETTSTQFHYNGKPKDDIDALLVQAIKALEAERAALGNCPVHNISRGRIVQHGENFQSIPRKAPVLSADKNADMREALRSTRRGQSNGFPT